MAIIEELDKIFIATPVVLVAHCTFVSFSLSKSLLYNMLGLNNHVIIVYYT